MQKPVEKPIKFIKNLSTKGKSYPITHVSAVIDDNGESVKSTIDSLKNKSSITKVTWLELKNKRDAGKLIPGSLYRITDYNCTTTQENTKSAGHQFDIILLALSESKLAEEGWAMMHDNIYDVVFNDGTIEKCYVYEYEQGQYNIVRTDNLSGLDVADEGQFDGEEFNAGDYGYNDLINEGLTYNYFQNSNLSAWKVWYCLDNDTNRFAWADDGEAPAIKDLEGYGVNVLLVRDSTKDNFDAYAWFNEAEDGILYTMSPIPKIGDVTYEEGDNGLVAFGQVDVVQGFGRGVIYRLIDEFNNDCPYDFKNIQFKRKLNADGNYDPEGGEYTWLHTFAGRSYNVTEEVYSDWKDGSLEAPYGHENDEYGSTYHDNVIKSYILVFDPEHEDASKCGKAYLNDNVFMGYWEEIGSSDVELPYYTSHCAYGNYFEIDSYENTMLSNFHNNIFRNNCGRNTFGNNCYGNTFGNHCESNTFGDGFFNNTLGNACVGNKFGNECGNNSFGHVFDFQTISDNTSSKNYGNNGVELATKNDIGDIETALNNI